MKAFFTEMLYIFALSKKTQLAFAFGLLFFIGISLLGDYFVSTLYFSGSVAGIEKAIIPGLLRHYDKAALIGLISFWILAAKCYRRDRDRFF